MTLLFTDSFDHYVTADIAKKGYVTASSNTIGAFGRFGTNGLRSGNSIVAGTPWVLPSALATIIVGLAVRFDTVATIPPIIQLYDGTTLHLSVVVHSTGKIRVIRGDGTVLATGATTLSPTAYYHVQVKATIHDSTGAVTVKLNNVDEIVISGVDTRNGGNASVDRVTLGQSPGGGPGTFDNDDFWVCDTVDQSIAQPGSPANNDFLGDVRVECLFPNGNGNSSQLVGSDSNSTDNYLLVDETAYNSDTDYVESSTVTDKDTYAYSGLTSTSGSVVAVQVIAVARKTDAGVRSIATVARSGGTEEDSADKTLTSTYAFHRDIRGAKPGASAWSISDVNGAEFGVKVTA